ncbi:uncharacterized protein LOC142007314 [Carettochelys insculpta]|uniref:uncharacterized protein LOC142007314 n=1 Tax=Carettochelys insculpta TaxID=44489 RepID=UPI003EC062A7
MHLCLQGKPGRAQQEMSPELSCGAPEDNIRFQRHCCCHRKASDELSNIPESSMLNRSEGEAAQSNLTDVDRTNIKQWMKWMEGKYSEMETKQKDFEKRLRHNEEHYCECSRMHDSEESELKEDNRILKERLANILSNAMESHKSSENLNDSYRESAVLEMYDRLRTHEWEKFRHGALSSAIPITYEESSTLIQNVFGRCEDELSQRMDRIVEALQVPVWKETKSPFVSKELTPGLTREIRNHLKHLYSNCGEDFFQARSPPLLTWDQWKFQPLVHFTAECYKIYCLLLLQNPPIRAVWDTKEGEIPTSFIEHVDNKDVKDKTPFNFLWPVLVCGGNVLRKGVIYG